MIENINFVQSINDALQGSMDAFEFLYKSTLPSFKKAVMKYASNPSDIDDILQESYLKIFTNLESLENVNSFISWGINICKNEAVNFVTSKSAKKNDYVTMPDTTNEEGQPGLDEMKADSYSPEFNPEASIDQSETKRLLDEIIADLPENQRLVVTMWQDGYTQAEIADKLQANTNTVKSYFYRGKRAIESKVLAIEKQGTKLYGMAPFTFFLWIMHGFDTFYTPDVTGELSGSVLANVVSKMPEKAVDITKSSTDSIAKYGTDAMKKEVGITIVNKDQNSTSDISDNTEGPTGGTKAAEKSGSKMFMKTGGNISKFIGTAAAVVTIAVIGFIGYNFGGSNANISSNTESPVIEEESKKGNNENTESSSVIDIDEEETKRLASLYEGKWTVSDESSDLNNQIWLTIHDLQASVDGDVAGLIDVFHEIIYSGENEGEFYLDRDDRKDIEFSLSDNGSVITYSFGNENQTIKYNTLTLNFGNDGLESCDLTAYSNEDDIEYFTYHFTGQKVDEFPYITIRSDYEYASEFITNNFMYGKTVGFSYNTDDDGISHFDFSDVDVGYITSVNVTNGRNGTSKAITIITQPNCEVFFPSSKENMPPSVTAVTTLYKTPENADDELTLTNTDIIIRGDTSTDNFSIEYYISPTGIIFIEKRTFNSFSSNKNIDGLNISAVFIGEDNMFHGLILGNDGLYQLDYFTEYANDEENTQVYSIALHIDNTIWPNSSDPVLKNLKPDESIKNSDPQIYKAQIDTLQNINALGINLTHSGTDENGSLIEQDPSFTSLALIRSGYSDTLGNTLTFTNTF